MRVKQLVNKSPAPQGRQLPVITTVMITKAKMIVETTISTMITVIAMTNAIYRSSLPTRFE
ncbi:MAG: hypothetical protein AB8G99_05160 [Planctomycetaceae bacterium]